MCAIVQNSPNRKFGINVYFIRHASAENISSVADFERALTEEGKDEAKTVAKFCQKNGIIPDKLISSPYKRALQTASVFSKNVGNCPSPAVVDWLGLDVDINLIYYQFGTMIEKVVDNKLNSKVVVVSHEPNISGLISMLIGEKKLEHSVIHIGRASLTAVNIVDSQNLRGELMFSVPVQLME